MKMFCLNVFSIILVLIVFARACDTLYSIKILSDFSKEEDLTFFRTTLPWIVENVGPRIRINYYFRTDQNHDITKECTLTEMRGNIHYQVMYLSKVAKGMPTNEAVSNFPINNRRYALCLNRNANYYIKPATREFSKIKSKDTPVIVLPGRKELSGVKPESMLKSICSLFRRDEPIGCTNSTSYPKQNDATDVTPKTDTSTKVVTTDSEASSEYTTVTSGDTTVTNRAKPTDSQESVTTQKEPNSAPNLSTTIGDTPAPSTDKATNPELNTEVNDKISQQKTL